MQLVHYNIEMKGTSLKEKIKNFFRNTKDSVCHIFNKLSSALKTFGTGAKDKISSEWIALIDFWGSLFFLSAIIIALKPELLSPFINQNMSDVSRVTKSFSYVGAHFLKITVKDIIADSRILHLRNAFVLILLVFYLLVKITVIFHSKKTLHKIVSFLLASMSLVSCVLIADKFLFFMLFTTMLFACFQYSVGLTTKQLVKKFFLLLFIELIFYITTLLLETPDFISGCTLLGSGIAQAFSHFPFPSIRWW